MKSTWNNVRGWLSVGERAVWLQYGILAVILLLPILLPGYVLTLDMVFTPHLPWPQEVTNTYPLDVFLWLLNQVLPGDVVQKIVLLAILILSGVGMHLLVHAVKDSPSAHHQPFTYELAAYFAGILYMINPFIYARLMAGQWLVLLGYALLPFLARALFRLLERPDWRNTVIVALWAFAVTIASVHMIGVVAVLAVLFLIAAVVRYWQQKTTIISVAWRIVAASGLALLMASYWIVPTLFGWGAASEIATRAGEAEFSAFATHGGPLGPVGEVLRLQGFWVEARQLFVLPQDVMPLWGLLVLLLWVLVGFGAVYAWKVNRPVAIVAIGAVVIGVVLAASPFVQWLAQTIPLLGGWREPHKFTALVVVGYAILGAYGVLWTTKKWRAKTWVIACLILPLLITPTMLWAGGGQLRTVDYPRQWYALNTRLTELVQPNERVLFLPWHMYAPYSFSNGRIIANPADKFFEVPIIISDDPEFGDVAPNRANEMKQQIADLLKNPQNVAVRLAALDIYYIILAKEQSWQDYAFLGTLPVIYEDEKIILYEVNHEK